jgi:hypothetical protein
MLSRDDSPAMDRRALLRNAILLVGGVAAGLPGQVLAQAADDTPEATDNSPQVRFFTPVQFATLAAYADTVIPRTDTPGAKDAGVPEYLDALMTNWASAERKMQFQALLDEADARARSEGGALPTLPAAQRLEVVRAFDADKLNAQDWPYTKFKELLLTLYYLSEEGATKELRYELIPGKFEPGIEVTSDTRAWAV